MPLALLIGCHIALGATATIIGAAAMRAPKQPGPHPRRGRAYLTALAGVILTGAALAATDIAHLWHLATLAAATAALATTGYLARRIRWRGWLPWHLTTMAASYTTMLTAFYVDNGPRLPGWNLLPLITFWFLPTAIALPLIANALQRHRNKTARRPRR